MAYLAIDLGASGGRAIAGTIENNKIVLEEIHRFTNGPVELNGTLYWDFLYLFDQIRQSLQRCHNADIKIEGIGVDTWGVDFGLIDSCGDLAQNPVCYRDRRTAGTMPEAEKRIEAKQQYAVSGIQQMEINTLYQLFSLCRAKKPILNISSKLLFMPDLINYFLTGNSFNEYTIASTSQLLNASTRQWDKDLFNSIGLPLSLMQPIIQPGEKVGNLRKELSLETGLGEVLVFAVGSHDTASAIGAIPQSGNDCAFLSSGTWSLLGMVSDEPILNSQAFKNQFTNEGGVNGKILFMRNITGLWILQCLKKEWEEKAGATINYKTLVYEASLAKPLQFVIDCDDPTFVHPASMAEAIQSWCKQHQMAAPQTMGEYVRCVTESLAVKYHFVIDQLQQVSGRTFKKLYIVGGGNQNRLLNQFTANALNMEVTAGLTEGTAVGNLLQQMIANGTLKNWDEAHSIINNTIESKTFYPQNAEEWSKHINRVSRFLVTDLDKQKGAN